MLQMKLLTAQLYCLAVEILRQQPVVTATQLFQSCQVIKLKVMRGYSTWSGLLENVQKPDNDFVMFFA